MKKALALVLALVLALSLGVSAFALQLVELKPAKASSGSLIPVTELPNLEDGESVLIAGEGDTYYVQLDNEDYKNVTVSASGAVSAKVVEYDPTVYAYAKGIEYGVYDKLAGKYITPDEAAAVLNAGNRYVAIAASTGDSYAVNGYVVLDGKFYYQELEYLKDGDGKVVKYDAAGANSANAALEAAGLTDAPKVKAGDSVKILGELKEVGTSYAEMNAIANILNIAGTTTKYEARTEDNTTLIEITVEDNYSAAYTEGTIKISATLNKKAVSAKLTVIRDVTIFGYEEVKWAAKYGEPLVTGKLGYSDYKTAENGYKQAGLVLDSPRAMVVSTTAFRAIEGEDLEVKAGEDLVVSIFDVAAGQKGVNFESYDVCKLNKDGVPVEKAPVDKKVASIEFGFYGNQKIASDFEIEVNLDMTYFGLRETFGKKVEEEDILTYYVLKDGKVVDSFTVDYMKVDPNDKVELVIEGKAGDTLGQYAIVIEAPSAPEAPAGEENPNTGAESVIGVVAAMAVVSVAAAAAVSLKK